ncbi:MAG TPA: prephenate dehydrogenase [Anaerolineae bacterium]|nr:prephenate dehydrogenase [Anaerolineae bacterium]
MSKPRITIVGLGFIGGSIGLALHQAEGDFEVVGHDRERNVATQAQKIGAVDRIHWNLISACEDADLIVMAIPISGIKDTLEAIGPYVKAGSLITDTATTKAQVIRWAEEILPEGVHFVGGDPVVGDGSAGGIDAARADLFSGAIYCLTPAASAAPDAVRLASDFVSLLGAMPYFLDPLEHDGLMAGVDHLPFVLSAALLGITTESAAWREMRKLAGGVFEEATRFVSADPMAYRDACLVNSENIVRWIDACSERLAELRETILARDSEKLGQVFETALMARQRWLKAR